MEELIFQFLSEAFTMPTAVFSGLLCLVLLNVVASLFGFSADTLDAADGLADGVLDGVADAALDGVADGVLDGVTDGALDGVADGALDGVEGGFEIGGEPSLMERSGASDMPKSFFLTVFSVFGWLFTFFGMRYLPDLLSLAGKGAMVAVVVASISVTLAIGATIAVLIPMARFFKLEQATQHQDLIGRSCVITTLKVTSTFGQAEVDGSSLLVQVRSDEPNTLVLHSRALIFSYDAKKEAFFVSSIQEGDQDAAFQ